MTDILIVLFYYYRFSYLMFCFKFTESIENHEHFLFIRIACQFFFYKTGFGLNNINMMKGNESGNIEIFQNSSFYGIFKTDAVLKEKWTL